MFDACCRLFCWRYLFAFMVLDVCQVLKHEAKKMVDSLGNQSKEDVDSFDLSAGHKGFTVIILGRDKRRRSN